MQRLVSTFQKWWFRLQQQRLWKTTEKIWSCGIAGIAGRRFNLNPKTISKSIGSWPGNYFQTLICHWKQPEERKMGAIRIKRKRHWKAKNYLWNFVWSFQKKVIFASHCYWRWKVDLFRQSQTQKIMGRPWSTIITTSTQYSWKQSFTVYLVGSEGSCVLWTVKTWWNGYWWLLPTTINKIESSVEAKTTRMGGQNKQSNFAP